MHARLATISRVTSRFGPSARKEARIALNPVLETLRLCDRMNGTSNRIFHDRMKNFPRKVYLKKKERDHFVKTVFTLIDRG